MTQKIFSLIIYNLTVVYAQFHAHFNHLKILFLSKNYFLGTI